jgi:hypothetical protein
MQPTVFHFLIPIRSTSKLLLGQPRIRGLTKGVYYSARGRFLLFDPFCEFSMQESDHRTAIEFAIIVTIDLQEGEFEMTCPTAASAEYKAPFDASQVLQQQLLLEVKALSVSAIVSLSARSHRRWAGRKWSTNLDLCPFCGSTHSQISTMDPHVCRLRRAFENSHPEYRYLGNDQWRSSLSFKSPNLSEPNLLTVQKTDPEHRASACNLPASLDRA